MQTSKARRSATGTPWHIRTAFEMPKLRSINPQTLDPILELLSDDPSRSMEAAKRLIGMPPVPAIALRLAFIAARPEYRDRSRIAAAYALGFYPISARSSHQFVLREILQNRANSVRIRTHAAEALGNLGDREAVEFLREIMMDDRESTTLRKWCIFALSEIGTPNSQRALVDFAKTKPNGVLASEIFSACSGCLQEAV